MIELLKKEIKLFFSSPIGYVVIAVFLLATSLFLWFFPGQYNVIDSGYADLNGLFVLAPWLYLFLCPAVTMRLFAEERSAGTLELLMTKPLPIYKIVFGKAFAAWIVVALSLLPTLIWYLILYYIAEPVGNVDGAAFMGSWLGLLFLSMVYCSLGTFGSALSENQIVAFVSAAVLCFLCYYGFDLVASLFSGNTALFIKSLGVKEHYTSISMGVMDTGDLAYFALLSSVVLSLCGLFIKKH